MVNLDFKVIGVNDVTTDPTVRFKCVTTDGNKLYIGSDTSLDESAHVWEYSNDTFSKITDNLEPESFKAVEDILVDNKNLYVGVGDAYASSSNYRGQVWVNNSLKWTDTNLGSPSVNSSTNYIRKLLKVGGKIYAAGSRNELFVLDKSGWDTVITAAGGGKYPGRSDILDSYLRIEHFIDMATDETSIYASVLENEENAQPLTIAGAFTPSGIIKYSLSSNTLTQFSPPVSYGAGGNRFFNKIHYDDGYLYAATHNSLSGTEVWRSPVSSQDWTQINDNGFGELESYVVNDIKTVDDCIVVSVMNSGGSQIWAYDKTSNEWTQQTIDTETPYTAYYIQTMGSVNYLVGQAVQYLTQESKEKLTYSSPQTYASGIPHFFDNGIYSIPVGETGEYRFISNNGPYPVVTQGTLDDPVQSILSPYVSRQADIDRGARGWCSPFDIYDTGASSTLVSSFRYTEVLAKRPSFFSGELGNDLNGSGFEMGIYDQSTGTLLSSVLFSAMDQYGGASGYENSGIRLYHPQTLWYDEVEDLTLIPIYVEEGVWGSGAPPATGPAFPTECGGPRNTIREGRHKRASRLLVSEDKGLSFSDCGYLITLPFNNVPNDNLTSSGVIMGPANTAIIKRADPITGEDYLYVYFDKFKNNINQVANSLSVARAPYSSVIAAARNANIEDDVEFSAYYNGSWSQVFGNSASASDVYPPNFRGYGGYYLNQPQILKCTNSPVYAAMGGAPSLVYDPYIAAVDVIGHLQSLYSEDGVTFSYPQRIIARTPDFTKDGNNAAVSPKYFSQYGSKSHIGETGDSFRSMDNRYSLTTEYGPYTDSFWQTQELHITDLSSSRVPDPGRSFEVGRYVFNFDSKYAIDRDQLPGIYAAMHRIKEKEKYLNAELIVGIPGLQEDIQELLPFSGDPNVLSAINQLEDLVNSWTSGVTLSYVNSATNGDIEFLSDPNDTLKNLYGFPKNVDNYYSFKFGRDLHRLYHIYHENFQWHRLSPEVQTQDGANLFSHTFGPLLYNHNFEKLGSVNDLVASSFSNPAKITVTSAPFVSSGFYVASGDTDMYLDTFERVSSGILDGVELVLTSGTEDDSSFSVIKVPSSQRASYEDSFLFDKTMLLMRSGIGAATRLRFDISKYDSESTYPINKNFLSPEHDFKLNFDSLISRDSGTLLGGRAIGVWIHTKPEDGNMWSFTPDNKWVQHDQSVSRLDMLTKYAHKKVFESKENDPQETSATTNYACLDQVSTNRSSPIIGLSEEDFENFEIRFDTHNRHIRLSRDYQKQYNKLHRLDQNYVIEIFVYPGTSPDQFMLINSVHVQDLTLKKLSEIFAAGTESDPLCVLKDLKRGCTELRVKLSKQDIFDIFKYFNDIAGKGAAPAYAGRDESKTETIMESRGGSRIEYRFPNSLITITPGTSNLWYSEVTIPV